MFLSCESNADSDMPQRACSDTTATRTARSNAEEHKHSAEQPLHVLLRILLSRSRAGVLAPKLKDAIKILLLSGDREKVRTAQNLLAMSPQPSLRTQTRQNHTDNEGSTDTGGMDETTSIVQKEEGTTEQPTAPSEGHDTKKPIPGYCQWRGALLRLTFFPLSETEPKGGVIIDDVSTILAQNKRPLIIMAIPALKIGFYHATRLIGFAGNLKCEMQGLCEQFSLNTRSSISDNAESQLAALTGTWGSQDLKIKIESCVQSEGRLDRRELRTLSIDALETMDIDDALSVQEVGGGVYRVGVHIADVSYFLQRNSPLDLEARHRATSIYLPDHRVSPMLPVLLSQDLFSLLPGKDRLTISVFWDMTLDGEMVKESVDFKRTVIRNCCKLDHSTAQQIIDEFKNPVDGINVWRMAKRTKILENIKTCPDVRPDDVAKDILVLHKLATASRLRRGGVSFNQYKLSFDFDNTGQPIRFNASGNTSGNELMAEFMVLTNHLVATQLFEKVKTPLLFVQPPPQQYQLEKLELQLRKAGIEIDASSVQALERSMASVSPEHQVFLERKLIGIMRPGSYKVLENKSDEVCHFGVNMPLYTHFTSPIRRYADVIVHRMLLQALGLQKECEYEANELFAITGTVARATQEAKCIEKRATDLHVCSVFGMQQWGGMRTKAIVIDIQEQGNRGFFKIFVPDLCLDRKLQVDRDLGGGVFACVEEQQSLYLCKSTHSPIHIPLFESFWVRACVSSTHPPVVNLDFTAAFHDD